MAALRHHDLCFGCGRTNLFGLLGEIEMVEPGRVAGRCFIKQDHQGPKASQAHPGVVATALVEAMSLALGDGAWPETVQVEFAAGAPVGAFLELEATVDEASHEVSATASHETHRVASAVGSFTRGPQLHPTDPR